jgi:hypothetical protein
VTHEEICPECRAQLEAGDGIDTRKCFLCHAMVCRHLARKGRIRVDGGAWGEEIVCKDPFPCAKRHGERVIK